MKRFCLVVGLLCMFAVPAQAGEWKPSQMITCIVPWAAGGASDLTARILAGEMESILGARVAVVNQPGASGATGTKTAYDMPHDGYTWIGNATGNMALYQMQGLVPDMPFRDWQAYIAVITPAVICVNPDSPIKDWDSLVEAFKTREVNVATAGVGSGGHIAAELFAKTLGVKYKQIPYKGGNPAVVAVVSGESEVVMQLSQEVSDMILGGKLRAIAVMNTTPLKIGDLPPIPAATDFVKNMPSQTSNFGLFLPRDIPADVAATFSAAFTKAAQSKSLRDMAESKACQVVNLQGKEADAVMERVASSHGWILYEAGELKASPETFGIAKPTTGK